MAIAVNVAKARLKKNELSIGIGIRLVRNVDIIKVMKAAGFDWLFIDLEHGSMSIETACEISVAAQDSGIAPIVRVPYGELTMATRVLDGGALGVVIPHVDTPEEAKEIADKLRYPPRGHRSVGGGQAQFDYAPMPLGEMTAKIDDNTLITVMIETPKAVENAEAIAAVPGIDCLLMGSSDLSMEMGIPGDGKPEDPGRRRQGRGRLQEAWQVAGHGRRLHRRTAEALHREGHALPALRQRPAHAHGRRPRAPGEGQGIPEVTARRARS